MVNIFGWFNKCDTAIYWIHEVAWNIKEKDTVRAAAAQTKVRINVVDSTENGYKMDYTFLECLPDTLPESAPLMQKFQNELMSRVSKKIIGTTIHFETDELGSITKINNLKQINKRSKDIIKEVAKEMSQLPEIKQIKEKAYDLDKYIIRALPPEIVDEICIKDLRTLFMYHGYSLNPGVFEEHTEATDSTYETDAYMIVENDPEYGTNHITYGETKIIPENRLNEAIGTIFKAISEQSGKEIPDQLPVSAKYEEFLKINYLPNGWPYYISNEKTKILGNRNTVNQTFIALDSYHFAE